MYDVPYLAEMWCPHLLPALLNVFTSLDMPFSGFRSSKLKNQNISSRLNFMNNSLDLLKEFKDTGCATDGPCATFRTCTVHRNT